MSLKADIFALLVGDREAERVVPPTGFTVRLTVFSSAAMAFLAVFCLALAFATDRLADRWSDGLARTSTVRITAPKAQEALQVQAVLRVLETTPGIASSRALTVQEQKDLLTPWFGPDLPIDTLPIPRLVEVVESEEGFDSEGLRQRLAAEAPGALLDDHTRWRKPLIDAAGRLRLLGMSALLLIVLTTAAIVTLAAQAALSANTQLIKTLRLVGAKDTYIARAFVRRFSLRSALGAALGGIIGAFALFMMPSMDGSGDFLVGLGFQGGEWLWLFVFPPISGFVAFIATRFAALRMLRSLS